MLPSIPTVLFLSRYVRIISDRKQPRNHHIHANRGPHLDGRRAKNVLQQVKNERQSCKTYVCTFSKLMSFIERCGRPAIRLSMDNIYVPCGLASQFHCQRLTQKQLKFLELMIRQKGIKT